MTQRLSQQISSQTWAVLVFGAATPAERERARQAAAPVFAQAYAPVDNDLLALSEQEARAGAKIIVWSEGGAGVL